MAGEHQQTIDQEIERHSDALHELSAAIHSHPELNYEEKFAHAYLTDFLARTDANRHGPVQRHYVGIDTAFRVDAMSKDFDRKRGHPTIGICAEYDALPEIGHACGHNLIAEAAVGAFLALSKLIDSGALTECRVALLGTPAEEGGGGKIIMLDKGAFDDIDAAMMVHGAPVDILYTPMIANEQGRAIFHGKASHAAAAPDLGINALDACVSAYEALARLRQQIRPRSRIHAIISDGGTRINVISAHAAIEFGLRAQTTGELDQLHARVKTAIEAGARGVHGCRVEIEPTGRRHESVLHNDTMAQIYRRVHAAQGAQFISASVLGDVVVSTDMGNVSHHVPSIHPSFAIATAAYPHTVEFERASGAAAAQAPTKRAAKSMALTVVEMLQGGADLMKKIRAEFDHSIAAGL